MKTLMLALLALTSATSAHARVLAVTLDKESSNSSRNVYVATVEACPNSFQSVMPQVRKIGDNAALVVLKPVLRIEDCRREPVEARFYLAIDHKLANLGLNPLTAELFFQLQ